MRVRTIRRHINDRAPQPVKNVGRKYEVSEALARSLIRDRLVVKEEPKGAKPEAPAED